MAEEGIWDSWEDFADSKDLDKHVAQHLHLTNGGSHHDVEDDFDPDDDFSKVNSISVDSGDNGKKTGTQFRILPRPVVHEDDMNRTAYMPQVKILKRPGSDVQAKHGLDQEKQKSQPTRSLAEREAAYAEARKRIMGHVPEKNNPAAPAVGKSRPENRKARTPKESSLSNSVQTERQPKGPDKNGRGFNAQR